MNRIKLQLTGKTQSELIADALKAMEPMAAMRARIETEVQRATTAFAVISASLDALHANVGGSAEGENDYGSVVLSWSHIGDEGWILSITAQVADLVDAECVTRPVMWWTSRSVHVFLFASTLCADLINEVASNMEACVSVTTK